MTLAGLIKRRQRSLEYYYRNRSKILFNNNSEDSKRIKLKAHLKRKYNITIEEYETMVNIQNNKCAICKRPETRLDKRTGQICRLSVDHCHKTGKVRNLLCNICNNALGIVQDNTELLHKLSLYLEEHNNAPGDIGSVAGESSDGTSA